MPKETDELGQVPEEYKQFAKPLQKGDPRVLDYFPGFAQALEQQLEHDEKRWGRANLELPKEGQEDRIMADINRYYEEFQKQGTPIPWLKIAGNAVIGWLREIHPELSENWK